MKFENTKVMNFENAFKGMRNPLESWNKSDSYFGIINKEEESNVIIPIAETWANAYTELDSKKKYTPEYYQKLEEYRTKLHKEGILQQTDKIEEVAFLGVKDIELAQRLVNAGSEHRKFMRQIAVSVDITAPIFFWKELSTYKVGTTANSTSTMHKIASTPITIDCFETDDYKTYTPSELNVFSDELPYRYATVEEESGYIIEFLESLRLKYNETKDKRYWKELIRWLPESWLQTRTWTANYEVLLNIYHQRLGHKLAEWASFIQWIGTLPYAHDLIIH